MAALSCALLGLFLAQACSPVEGRGTNVVLVTLDTTRADFFGCYGAPIPTTPNFDALAERGVLFEHCASVSAVTPVSHASILTGLYPAEHGLRVMYAKSGFRMSPEVPTLPEILGRAGYRTGAFLSSYPVSEIFGFDRGFDAFDRPRLPAGSAEVEVKETDATWGWNSKQQRRSDVTTELALEWLAESDEPFFLWVHYWDVHGGSDFPDRDLLLEFAPRLASPSFDPRNPSMTEAEVRGLYAAQLKMIDRQFGRLVAELERRGLADDTIVAVISDHGEGLGDHGWPHHRILYQEQMRLPFLLFAPGLPGAQRISDLVRSIDLAPTILDLLDLPAPPVQGQSLAPLARGEGQGPALAYAEQLNALDLNARMLAKRPLDGFLHAVTDGDWKLIYRPEPLAEHSELYHLAVDPREEHNLWGQGLPEQERLLSALRELDAFRSEPFPESAEGSPPPDEEALTGLGYFGAGDDHDHGHE